MSIIEPSPLHPHQAKSLIVGLSEPGTVIDHLPEAVINEIGLSDNRGLSASNQTRSRALSLPDSFDSTGLTAKSSSGQHPSLQDEQLRQKIKADLSLPGVLVEIDNLRTALPATVLLNENFKVENFRQELLGEPYSIVHIASHLITGANAASSFIMAYDDVIHLISWTLYSAPASSPTNRLKCSRSAPAKQPKAMTAHPWG